VAASLVAGALDAGVVDRMMLFYAPIIIGGTETQSPGVAGRRLSASPMR
jgi:riboflavin biosynthesis pyrimidine reductase